MERQSIFERVMSGEGSAADAIPEQKAAVECGNKETETVKTHNRLLLMSGVGVIVLATLGTVVLARQNVISLPGISSESVKTARAEAGAAPATIELAQADGQKAGAGGSVAPAATVPPPRRTVFNEHVDKSGVTACKDVFPALGFGAAAGSIFNATTSWSDKDPNQHSISSIVGMSFNTDQLKGSGASFVFSMPAPAKGGCEGMFVRVVPIAQDCSRFASSLPKESTVGQSLQGIPVIKLPNGSTTLLIPTAGNGCVVLTTSKAQTAARKE